MLGVGEGVTLGVAVADVVAVSGVRVGDTPKDTVGVPVPVNEGVAVALTVGEVDVDGKATPASVNLLNLKLPAPWQPEQVAAPMPMQSPACPSARGGREKGGKASFRRLTGNAVTPLALGSGAHGPPGPPTEYCNV